MTIDQTMVAGPFMVSEVASEKTLLMLVDIDLTYS